MIILLPTFAEIGMSPFALLTLCEPSARAVSVTSKSPFTHFALLSEEFTFVFTKFLLFKTIYHRF